MTISFTFQSTILYGLLKIHEEWTSSQSWLSIFRLILINILIIFVSKFYLIHSTYYKNSSMHINKMAALPPKIKCDKVRVHLIINVIAKFQNLNFCWHISRKEQKCVHILKISHLTTLWLCFKCVSYKNLIFCLNNTTLTVLDIKCLVIKQQQRQINIT